MNKHTDTSYYLSAYKFNSWCYPDEYTEFEEDQLDKALAAYEAAAKLYENATLTKQMLITETIKEKKTEHVCTFEDTGYAKFDSDEKGDFVQPELMCTVCHKKTEGEKFYVEIKQ